MARFSPQLLQEIKNRLTLSDIVGRRVSWHRQKSQPQRGDYWACCPFHNEKTPSFHVDDRREIYKCFGCGKSGDHFTFLTDKEGLSFPEAVERLADEAGVALPKADPREAEREKKRATLFDVVKLAQDFFRQSLQESGGAAARGYLQKRGLTPETQRRFGIGYAPKSRNALKEHLAGKGIDHHQMVEAGLLVAGPDIPVSYDKFRDRIMFPILDLRERPIAFGGRAMDPDNPAKYMNSPETPLFSKRSVLYNAAAARSAARDRGRVIAVEGYMDVIALAQAGIDEALAPLGTAPHTGTTEPYLEDGERADPVFRWRWRRSTGRLPRD
ncbi:MAG: DNA primase [Pseudomonadota bacterium]